MTEEPRRLRWSVPAADVSTNRWLDGQENISRSLQLLIRESIQRDGYIDVVNRPVEQLPRRGRPPSATGDLADARIAERNEDGESDGHHVAAEGARAQGPIRDQTAEHEARSDSKPAATISSPQVEHETAPPRETQPPSTTSAPDGPLDMDAIFSNRR
ncbi:hypothetical protein L3Q67_26500 [Saccharothrix sp. AJ9571]|nr:hypothetical protein L3Q67_26500 [Saccharothrix sp. AJ9571]